MPLCLSASWHVCHGSITHLMYTDRPCWRDSACMCCWPEASERQGAVPVSHAEVVRLSHLSTPLFW